MSKSRFFAEAARRYHEARAEYEVYTEGRYARAMDDCAGVLLSQRGRQAGVSSYSLFSGPWVRVQAYGSRELQDWFAANGRMTYTEWENQYE